MRNKISLMMFAYFFITLAGAGKLLAQAVIDDIPDGCNNNYKLYTNKGSHIDAGPTWVEKCSDVCSFDKKGKVTEKISLWFSRRACEQEHSIVSVKCIASKVSGCNELVWDRTDPENHDCYSNPGGAAMWHCKEELLPVKCMYGNSQIYKAKIPFAYCDKK
jgi:hypothetical protein